MRNGVKNLQKVTARLEKLGRFDFLEFQEFYQTNMHHINF